MNASTIESVHVLMAAAPSARNATHMNGTSITGTPNAPFADAKYAETKAVGHGSGLPSASPSAPASAHDSCDEAEPAATRQAPRTDNVTSIDYVSPAAVVATTAQFEDLQVRQRVYRMFLLKSSPISMSLNEIWSLNQSFRVSQG